MKTPRTDAEATDGRKLRKEAEAVKDSLAKLSAARDAFLTSGNPEDLLKAIQQG